MRQEGLVRIGGCRTRDALGDELLHENIAAMSKRSWLVSPGSS
jgi:hypothetical protein